MESLPPRRPPTIADVARRAGVGVATVSRVINGSPNVRPATRRAVLAVISELQYQPSRSGRRLSLGLTLTVGVVVPFLTHPSAVERVRGVIAGLRESRYDIVLFDVETPAQRERRLRAVADPGRVDGVVVVSLSPTDAEVDRFAAAAVPAVLVDARHPRLTSVAIDDEEGGRLAARHLVDLGHVRIGFVGDESDDDFGRTRSERRRSGFERGLAEAGIGLEVDYVRRGGHARHVAHGMTRDLLGLPEPPSAIFAASDVQALGVLEAAARANVDVPRDLSVIGFDDLEIAAYVGLTTVRQPLVGSGRRGAELLLGSLGGRNGRRQETLPVELVARLTTAPPRRVSRAS